MNCLAVLTYYNASFKMENFQDHQLSAYSRHSRPYRLFNICYLGCKFHLCEFLPAFPAYSFLPVALIG